MDRPLSPASALILALALAGALPGGGVLAQAVPVTHDTAGGETDAQRARHARLAQGAMAKFRFAQRSNMVPDLELALAGGGRTLSSWRGQTLLLHFWASWCAPCRLEIPQIARLERRLGDPSFAVFTVSLDDTFEEASRFLDALGAAQLPHASDPRGKSVAARLGAAGLPTSILIGPDGREIGRLEGAAEWLSDDAILLLMAVLREQRQGVPQ